MHMYCRSDLRLPNVLLHISFVIDWSSDKLWTHVMLCSWTKCGPSVGHECLQKYNCEGGAHD